MEAKKNDEEELDAPIKPYFDTSIDSQEPKNLDAKADANTASSEQALADLASNDENIMVFDNPNKDEIKSYLAMMKQSDMPTDKKNQNMIVNIIEYLSNNMVDDNAARALSNLDLGSPEGRKTGMQVAVKYLKGKVELQAPKAKKDKFGKTKEDTTFEAYEQRMDMVSEGTWALPENEEEAMKLAAMMAQPVTLGDGGDDAASALGGLIGDDELFDDLGVAGDEDPSGDARPIIMGWLMDHVDDYGQNYKETMQMALDKIRADGNDSDITIPRTFGAQQDRGMSKKQADAAYNTSATQGERMGSNADDMKEADYDLSTLDGKYGNEPVKGKEGILQTDVEDDVNDIAATMEEDPELENFAMAFEKSVYASGDTSPEGIRAALEEVLPDYIAGSRIKDLMKVIESVHEANVEVEVEVDEAAEMIAKMRSMAGVGSGVRSNHGIHEGEEGYRLTPRSLVAREMRKLQDLEK